MLVIFSLKIIIYCMSHLWKMEKLEFAKLFALETSGVKLITRITLLSIEVYCEDPEDP